MCRCNGPRHGVRTGVSVSPPQARNFFENITAFLTLLHGSLCRNFYFSQRALLLAQRASSGDKLGGSAAGSLFHARRALLPFVARHRLLWRCYPYRGHSFAPGEHGLMVVHRGRGPEGAAHTVDAPGEHAEQVFTCPASVADQQ